MRSKLPLAIFVATVGALLTGISALAAREASKPTMGATAMVRISTRTVPGLGRVLVNSRGLTLYMFVPDKRKKVTCVSTCARIWPPVKLPAGAKITTVGGVKAKLLKSDKDPAGGRVVTYDGWPLYTYVGDRKPGTAAGQALNLNGGLWYVLATSGKVIKTKPTGATTTVKVSTRKVAGLGRVLTSSKGLTLYMFVPDKRKKVTCVSICAEVWPPVKLPAGAKIAAAGGVKAKLLRSDKDPAGGRVVTYDGWPLYTYAGDTKPGVATGQALNLNGGLWYVLATSGKVINTKPQSTSSNTATTLTTTTTATKTTTTTTGPAVDESQDPVCPAGTTIKTEGSGDGDSDELGNPSDGDGCV